jgi:cellulose synthase/poly-beta-1,6-N-acetylglucosamine synthase-like glycosyltransferase
MAIEILIWFMFGILIAYLLVIGTFIYGWKTSAISNNNINRNIIEVSVIIAVRNEEKNIRRLIESLSGQSFDKNKLEVIFINDNSADNTRQIIEESMSKSDLNIKLIDSMLSGKKNAIRQGVEIAGSEFIITTDGDCIMGPEWTTSIVNFYKGNNKKVVLGPVTYSNASDFMSKLYTVEFASLVSSGAGSALANLPLMGNGANLAFEKSIFNDYDDRSSISASGDDVFLIHHCATKYGNNSVGFIKSEDAIVYTDPPVSVKDFLNQRIRWASKASGYKLIWPIIVSLTVFLFNLKLTILLALSLVYLWALPVYLLLIITKLVIDFPLVFGYLNFVGKGKIKYLLILMEFVYPIYITLISLASFFGKFSWKGRNY